ncbi:putative late blight resistance protein homolog R1A-10 isoform X1 [Salvia hispanica]|uniref:putative late blight resistance protein homolog R1A-10 isoform X1 n=1 Tax=Salvia hispanica TaxID=49212 RepID=UPI0020091E5F|nr:putative late blight resistance protein homolog R1A-10 isoform X1 [Salvia hispanica]XP_047945617.1 putative late blight resistance protein homolog R1A-10 isoform X1 [Salvia hispanica]
MVKSREAGTSNRFIKKILTGHKKLLNLHSIGQTVEGISGRVTQLRNEIKLTADEDKKDIPSEPRPPRKDKNVVGFADMTERLIRRLTQEADGLDVISLTGMFGLGKTTLAWKIYNDPEIILKFPTRIWLTVSATFTEKDIFLRILGQLTTLDADLRSKDGDELADIVSNYLQMGTFLIVMDDVWSIPSWERLKKALPLQENKSKVLITSREETVGEAASKPRPFVPLRAFEPEESWELFRLEALGMLDCPPQLVNVGNKIAYDCDGLPLAIVVIGGILCELSDLNNMDTTKRNWTEVSEDVNSYLSEKDPQERMTKFISLSYENLPHYLRPCFLYLGLFPEDYEISASKLIRMWIGEGFIQQKDVRIPMEEVGQNYLKDLISRNLVKTLKLRADGNVKTCQIHETLRDFCRIEAATENFLQEIRLNEHGQCATPISEWCRRLSIHSDCKRYISSKSSTPRARSFVCFSKEPCDDLSGKDSTNLIKAFKFLRVFDIQPLILKAIDTDLYTLIHMRYIALSFTLSMLSPDFNKICNMQTLIINTTSPTLNVKANIWEMRYLRYFKTNASATLPVAKSSSDCANELQTLGLISVESCKGLHERAPNLKKLGIRGKLALLSDEKGPFESVKKMRYLGKLKLVNDKAQDTEQLNSLPKAHQFPSGLTSLTLCWTSLKWAEISTLRSLQKLEVLKLKYQAFIGSTWELEDVDGGFLSLQFLQIEQTDLTFWKAKSHHYPKLRSLVLKNCDKLREIPVDLARVQSFKMLDLTTCKDAVDAARNIAKEKETIFGEGSEFKLSIFPPPPAQ